jgi:hypothetical protein
MSQPELEPLSPDLLALLASEKARPRPPEAMQARVLASIGEDLLAGVPLAGQAAVPVPRPRLPVRLRRVPLAIGLLAVGGMGGAGLHALIARPHHASIPIASTPPPAPPAAEPAPAQPWDAAVSSKPERRTAPSVRRVPSLPQPSAPAPEPAQPLTRDDDLAAQRALLEQARMALARGKPADALVLLARHEKTFGEGRLSEEREALVILSLVADRKADAARAQATKFKQKYPRSMLLRAIEAAFEAGR